jgi:DnaJ-domain-containing protein 1
MTAPRSTAERYPLSWPIGWKRTPAWDRARATFRKKETQRGPDSILRARQVVLSPADATQRLAAELDRLGARRALLSTNLEIRVDGVPRSNQREPADVGAAVYFDLADQPRCLACDKWDRVADNIAALAQHIDALRRIDRYGVGTTAQAFAGYAALPPTAVDWTIVLGVSATATTEEIIAAHRKLAHTHHPDKGGRLEDMARINEARDVALKAMLT